MIGHETRRVIVANATSTLDAVLDQVHAAGASPLVIALDPLATVFATPEHFRALDDAARGDKGQVTGDRGDRLSATNIAFAVDDPHRTGLALAFGYPVQPLASVSSQSEPTRSVVTRIGSGTRVFALPSPDGGETVAASLPDKPAIEDRAATPAARKRHRRKGGIGARILRCVAVCAVVAALLSAGGTVFVLQVHRATIDLFPTEESFTRTVPFAVSVETTSDPNALQTHLFETTVVREMDAPASGKKAIPDETATGSVTLRSRADAALTIRAGTTLRSGSDVSYVLQADVTVPGLDFGRGQLGEATGKVRASVAGPAGNLPAGATAKFTDNITYIMGAVTGGTEKQVTVISDDDVARARAQLENEARERALADTNKLIPPGVTPLNDFLKKEPPVTTATPPVGTQTETVHVRIAVPVRVPVYENSAFDALVRTRLAGVVAEINRNGGGAREVVAESVATKPPTYRGVQGTQVNYEAVVSGTMRAVISPESATRIGRTVAGRSAQDAAHIVQEEPGVGHFEVMYAPAWLPEVLRARMPRQPGNIAVRIAAGPG